MEAIFTIQAKDGRAWHRNKQDYFDYLLENDGQELTMTLKPVGKTSEKIRMYAYLFGPLMDCAVIGYAEQGWEGMDKVKARYMLEANFLKESMYNSKTGEIDVYTLDIAKVTKARLLKFIQDCIFFLETDLSQRVPDSSLYKMMQLTGKAFSSVKFKDDDK